MEQFILDLLKKIVTNPDSVVVAKTEDDFQIRYEITLADEDYGRVIGKGGKTINAIRNIAMLFKHNHENSEKRLYINLVDNRPR